MLQAHLAQCGAPGLGVVAEIVLFQLDHQLAQARCTQLRALSQYPVVAHDGIDHPAPLYRKELTVAMLGEEAWDRLVDAGEYLLMRVQMLGETVGFKLRTLFAQQAVDHARQGLHLQDLTGMGDQCFVERSHKGLFEQLREMCVQPCLQPRVRRVVPRPQPGDSIHQPGFVAVLGQVEHQVRPQADKQLLTVMHTVAYLVLQHLADPCQQVLQQCLLVRRVQYRAAHAALEQARELPPTRASRRSKDLGGCQSTVQ